MGNRAVVIFTNAAESSISPAIYLHWNGGPESIYAFLAELDRREVRADQEYEAARFVQIVGEYFDMVFHTPYSLGIRRGPPAITALSMKSIDPGNNGVYLVQRYAPDKKRGPSRFETRIKRFIEGELWSPAKVAAERRMALKSDYIEDIAAHFAKDKRPTESAWGKMTHRQRMKVTRSLEPKKSRRRPQTKPKK